MASGFLEKNINHDISRFEEKIALLTGLGLQQANDSNPLLNSLNIHSESKSTCYTSENALCADTDTNSTPKLQPPPLPQRPTDMAPFLRSATLPVSSLSNDDLYCSANDAGGEFSLPYCKKDSTSTVVEATSHAIIEETPSRAHQYPSENINNSENIFLSGSQSSPETQTDTHVSRRKWIGRWQLGRTIGEGSSGKVKLAHNADTKETCVVKAVRRPKLANGMTANSREANYVNPDGLEKIYKRELYMIREACVGMMLQHENIVKLHSAVLGENHFYCFFELVEGEDLVDFISREGPLGEARSREIFRKVLSAIEYGHRNHIVHRDIKLENIRYNSKTGIVKILDFGFASFYTPDSMLLTNCGSPCYAAPEIYDNAAYDGPMVDVWSLGVCLFGMVTGTLPFDGPDFKSLAAKVRAGKVSYPSELSNDLIALLSGMFRTDPRKRSNLFAVTSHPWVNAGYRVLPVDYLESSKTPEPIIQLEWVREVMNASVCQAGIMLMEALEQRIPARKLEEELPVDGHTESTDENDSIDDAEAEASKFVSNMTIKDKKRSNIWWRRLFWGVISRHFGKKDDKNAKSIEEQQQQLRLEEEYLIEKTGGTIANFVDKLRGKIIPSNDAQIPYERLIQTKLPLPRPKGRFRAFTNNMVNLFTPDKKATTVPPRHTRWSPFRPN